MMNDYKFSPGDLVNKIVLYPQDIDEPRSIDVDYRRVLT